MEINRRRILLIVAGVLALAAVVYGFWPDPVAVQVATVERGPLQVIVEEEGETQVRNRYEVSSPVAAFTRRIEVEAGDAVEQGDPLVQLEAPRAGILDPRSRAEAEAAVEQAEQQTDAAEAAAERAQEERQRVERLVEQGSATRQALEQAIAEERQATANLAAARAAVTRARAALYAAEAAAETQPVRDVLRAPVAGRILTVHRRSAGSVNPGEPLVEVGDTDLLEVHVDVLSQDAVRIEPGTPVRLEQWGGEPALEAVVDRVEPQGQTAVSALGVEEQRVTVVANLVSPPDQWDRLGSGYRVLARFIVWEGDDVLQVPTSALFRTDGGWAVFVVEDGVARRRAVTVGQQSGLTAQIASGLEDGETVIVHPDNELEDGVRVTRRDA